MQHLPSVRATGPFSSFSGSGSLFICYPRCPFLLEIRGAGISPENRSTAPELGGVGKPTVPTLQDPHGSCGWGGGCGAGGGPPYFIEKENSKENLGLVYF